MLPAPRSRWVSTIAFGLVIFACGAAAGVAVGVRWEDREDSRRSALREKQTKIERMVTHLTEDLGLSTNQAHTIHGILERHIEEFRDIHATISPKLKMQMDCLRDEVGECLDERQRVLWEEKVESIRKRTRAHF